MPTIIKDIISDPLEYLPFLSLLTSVSFVWLCLCLSGVASIRAHARKRKLWLATAPVILGGVALLAQMQFYIESAGINLRLDVRWIFLLPLLLGLTGIVSAFRMNER